MHRSILKIIIIQIRLKLIGNMTRYNKLWMITIIKEEPKTKQEEEDQI